MRVQSLRSIGWGESDQKSSMEKRIHTWKWKMSHWHIMHHAQYFAFYIFNMYFSKDYSRCFYKWKPVAGRLSPGFYLLSVKKEWYSSFCYFVLPLRSLYLKILSNVLSLLVSFQIKYISGGFINKRENYKSKRNKNELQLSGFFMLTAYVPRQVYSKKSIYIA